MAALRERQAGKPSGSAAAPEGGAGAPPAAVMLDEEEISSTLRLILVASELSDSLNKLEAQMRRAPGHTGDVCGVEGCGWVGSNV